MFSYVSPEARVPKDHPLRPIRITVDNALVALALLFQEIKADFWLFFQRPVNG
jgi:hypothetical protein